jgi:2,3-bisphosphoglycerate-dependent phosphoglycerate mutase
MSKKEAKYTLVVVRHGESEWNKANYFTGWADPDLTEKGVSEAKTGGKALKANGVSRRRGKMRR